MQPRDRVYRCGNRRPCPLYPTWKTAIIHQRKTSSPGGKMAAGKPFGIACAAVWLAGGAAFAQVIAPKVDNVSMPPGVDAFSLSLDDIKKYSSISNFELLGQSYFK